MENKKEKQLTLRGIIIGIIGSIIITTSSIYVALRMGALPWPTVFVAILSMTVLRVLGKTNLKEINVTQTAMSSGAMVAGGLAFTIPGIWIIGLESEINITSVLIVTIAGTILGAVFTALIRKYFIVQEPLPFPIGEAAYETLETSEKLGKNAAFLFISMGLSAIFVFIRDWFMLIPANINFSKLEEKKLHLGLWLSPMAVGIGYIVGPLYTGVWFIGAAIAYFLLIPLGVNLNIFGNEAIAEAFKNSLGIGLMIGTGLGILIKGILPKAKKIYGSSISNAGKKVKVSLPFIFALTVFVLTLFTEMSFLSSVLIIFGVWITTTMSASLTGQSGINPMEIFGIIILLFIKLVSGTGNIGSVEGFLIAAIVAIACGLTGDVMNDFKTGHLIGTDPKKQLIAETIGGVVGAVVSVFVLFFMVKAYGGVGPGTDLLAPQAYAVSTMVNGLPDTLGFTIGLIVGFILYIFNVPGMTLGLGFYLPMTISSVVFIGGILRFIFDRIRPKSTQKGIIISSGLLGGEGIAGVLIAIIKVLTAG
ncbi:MAG: hypothetical protein PWQ77_1874 [Kosmotogales bacterium]|nr:hypothetical protein [Kosmotogales bacterium]